MAGAASPTDQAGRSGGARSSGPLELEAAKPADEKDGKPDGAAPPSAPGPSREADQDSKQYQEFPAAEEARRYGREQLFDRSAAASGPDAKAFYFEQFTQHVTVGSRQVRVSKARIRDEARDAYLGSYVPVDRVHDMRSTLFDCHLVILYGRPGSGRHATAVHLLSGVRRSGWLGRLETEPDGLATLLSRGGGAAGSPIDTGDRIIIDLNGRPLRDDQWQILAERVREKSAYAVVIAPAKVPSGAEYPRDLAHLHRPPPADLVMRGNLTYRLGLHRQQECVDGCTDESVEEFAGSRCAIPEVARYLKVAESLHEVGEFAAELAEHVHTADTDVPDLLSRWRDRLRRKAEKLLEGAGSSAEKDDRLLLRRQVFRIAYAVFHGHPFSDVFYAGDLLLAHLTEQSPSRVRLAEVPRLIVDGNLRELLGEDMAAIDDSPAVSAAGPRRAELVDAELVPSILDVAWHDYHTLRRPLLDWLRALAIHPLVRVRVRVAQTAGLLARFDFDEVYRSLIRGWAEGPVNTRAAAADALDIAALDKTLAARVRQQVSDWARSSKAKLQDSAARAYGSATGAVDQAHAIRALTDLGSRRALADWNSIGLAMVQLSDAGAATEVVDALTAWIRSDKPDKSTLRDHAVRALLMLTRLAADADETGQLPGLADIPDRRDAVVLLWRRALADERTSRRAWKQFQQWLESADRRPELVDRMESLAAEILAYPLDARARFWLTLWGSRAPATSIFHRIKPDPRPL